ncbi:MAG: xanthine dehydrogenase family protein molybdopterin-binding subunit [Candidatus Eremiobacteraeota bacterium]|nr:xanthine dehydrogenase family protein molybdopterin-binding subunit [Candidatus Eremiobacteraeota bacterium]
MKELLIEPSIGKPLARVDGHAKVSGAARYAADFNQPGQAYAVIIQSTVGLGRIAALDATAANEVPGILAVISHLNAPKLAYKPHHSPLDPDGERLHVVQDDRVHFFGQPVAVVVAETLDNAEHAAALVDIRYEAQHPMLRVDAPEAQPISPNADLAPRGDADAAFSAAPVQIDAAYGIARENHNPMEPHATIAAWLDDRLTLWSKSQFLVAEAAEMAAVFDLPVENVQVINPFIGGAFGTSLRTWPHVTLAALAARYVNRPVKLVLTRRQMFSETGFRPRTTQRVAIGALPGGQLSSIVHEATAETSRYEQYTESTVTVSRYMYSCPAVRTRYRLLPLDVSTPIFMRGPGEASGVYALECAMDEMAAALAMDPIDFRLRNEPESDEGAGLPFSSRSLRACCELGAARFGWARRDPRPQSMRDGRLLIGWGMSAATYPASRAPSGARARLLADGTAEVEVAASDMGPGTYTSMTQVAADALELPVRSVRFVLGRSDFPAAPPHGGSMTMASVGSAVQAACLAVREKILKLAIGKEETYGDIVARLGGEPIEVEASSAPGDERSRFSMHGFGAIFAEVAVDPDLCTIRVRRMSGAYGAGRIINPRLAKSQCIGGMVGGIGMALLERTALDTRDGRVVNASMADYLVPVNLDIGDLEALFVEEEDPYVNPLGAKGVGELAYVGVAPAVANAVFHATGVRVRDLPIRIEDVLGAV